MSWFVCWTFFIKWVKAQNDFTKFVSLPVFNLRLHLIHRTVVALPSLAFLIQIPVCVCVCSRRWTRWSPAPPTLIFSCAAFRKLPSSKPSCASSCYIATTTTPSWIRCSRASAAIQGYAIYVCVCDRASRSLYELSCVGGAWAESTNWSKVTPAEYRSIWFFRTSLLHLLAVVLLIVYGW